ncbi:MFS transporter (plasmid) [Agrobacterium vitis]|uniref:MFS transporter n=1 Tax=Agrobacterium vitis TaxID=373 RepID=UPI0015D951C5|nr:MFS transporter [Agrobacterium vitis]BCH61963.1 MFS transporter [Agrobacterium vitis]
MLNAFAMLRASTPVFLLLFALQFISMGAMEMSGPFWPLQIRVLSPSDTAFGLASIGVYICPMLGISLTSAFWGRMGDRYGNRLMMVRALAGLAITQLLIALAQDVWVILFLRFLQGAFAGYIAPAQAYAVQVNSGRDRASLFAWLQVATNVGSLGGAFAGGLILDAMPFAAVNITAGAVCGLCALVAWATLPIPPIRQNAPRSASSALTPGHPESSAPVVGLLVLICVLLASRMVLQVPFSLYMTQAFGANHWIIGLSYGLMAFGFVIGAPLWARLFKMRSLGFVLAVNTAIALACASITLIAGYTTLVPVFAGLYFLWGILLGGTTPVLTSRLSQATSFNRQGEILGRVQSWQQIASILGIAAGVGSMQLRGADAAFPLVSACYILSFFIGLSLLLKSGPLPNRIG